MGFLPWEIRVAFPGESYLRQSRASQPGVYSLLNTNRTEKCFSVGYCTRPFSACVLKVAGKLCPRCTSSKLISAKCLHVCIGVCVCVCVCVWNAGLDFAYRDINVELHWLDFRSFEMIRKNCDFEGHCRYPVRRYLHDGVAWGTTPGVEGW